MNIAIDTNGYVDFARGLTEAVSRLRTAGRILVPLIVLGELRAGFLSGSRALENEAGLARFLNSPRVDVLLVDEDTTHHYARLFHQLRLSALRSRPTTSGSPRSWSSTSSTCSREIPISTTFHRFPDSETGPARLRGRGI